MSAPEWEWGQTERSFVGWRWTVGMRDTMDIRSGWCWRRKTAVKQADRLVLGMTDW